MRALSLVEKGWAGARQLSLDLARRGASVRHLVRGTLPPSTRRILTPCVGVSIRGIPARVHRAAVWPHLWWGQVIGGVDLVITDNAKTAGWVRRRFPRLREKVLLLGEGEGGRLTILEQGTEVRL